MGKPLLMKSLNSSVRASRLEHQKLLKPKRLRQEERDRLNSKRKAD
jgi:hypothetical protein